MFWVNWLGGFAVCVCLGAWWGTIFGLFCPFGFRSVDYLVVGGLLVFWVYVMVLWFCFCGFVGLVMMRF